METEKCSVFEKCDAPLCPRDLMDDRWFPSENICTYHNEDFIKMQKKISKKSKHPEKYFTIEMLNKKISIGKNIKGIDPECNDEKQAIKNWLLKHQERKKLKEEEKIKKRKRMAIINEARRK